MLSYYIEYNIVVSEPFFIHGHACIYVLCSSVNMPIFFVNLVLSTVAMYVTTVLDLLPQIGKALLAYTKLSSLYVFVKYYKLCRKHV